MNSPQEREPSAQGEASVLRPEVVQAMQEAMGSLDHEQLAWLCEKNPQVVKAHRMKDGKTALEFAVEMAYPAMAEAFLSIWPTGVLANLPTTALFDQAIDNLKWFWVEHFGSNPTERDKERNRQIRLDTAAALGRAAFEAEQWPLFSKILSEKFDPRSGGGNGFLEPVERLIAQLWAQMPSREKRLVFERLPFLGGSAVIVALAERDALQEAAAVSRPRQERGASDGPRSPLRL